MCNNKICKKIFSVIYLGTLLMALSACSSINNLVMLDDTAQIISSDSYRTMTAVVSAKGNCYIRGPLVESNSPYGVQDPKQYKYLYNSLNPSDADRFVQIYAFGDAIKVCLSESGGIIINSQNQLYLFSDDPGFETPTYFCDDVIDAKLLHDRVYILNSKNIWGYRKITSPKTFVEQRVNVKKAIVCLDESVWLLLEDSKLCIYESVKKLDEPVSYISNVDDFDVLCVENSPNLPHALYSFGYIDCYGNAFYYHGYGIPVAEVVVSLKNIFIDKIVAYSNGIIALTPDNKALVYGRDLLGTTSFAGDILAENVLDVSSGVTSFNLSLNPHGFISCGLLPSSKFVYINDIIKQRDEGT